MNALPGQMELATVIDHKRYPEYKVDDTSRAKTFAMVGDQPCLHAHEQTHKPAGVRLAKMLAQYEDSPSSQLWADIQRLAREILK